MAVEMRSLNGRFLELAFRLPDEMRALEPALREVVQPMLRRGKVELRISAAREAESQWPQPSPEQLHRLGGLESTVRGWLPEARPLSVNEVLQWCRQAPPARHPDDQVLDAVRRCTQALQEARAREGTRLAEMLLQRTAALRALARQAAPLVPEVVQRQQARFLERWNTALESVGESAGAVPESVRHERALAEAAATALRIDVAEELSRLTSHLDEVERLLAQGGELGKRLDFLMQELQREANTLGSKSAALELTRLSVEMKVLVEQMREQVQNLE